EKQREEWERQYAEAQTRFEQHQQQVIKSREAEEAEDAESDPVPHTHGSPDTHLYTTYSLGSTDSLPNVRH
ncbi:30S ribosomal protein S1, partial [Streptomyces sp. NPDC007808]